MRTIQFFTLVFCMKVNALAAQAGESSFRGGGVESPAKSQDSLFTEKSGLWELIEEDYLDDEESSLSVAGVLSATRDLFARTVAFDFSPAFFKRRSLGSEESSVLLNGVAMNKFNDGRPNWSNWGGLNDALRNQEFAPGFLSSLFSLGKLGGTVNMKTFAGLYARGLKMSVAASNKSYATRIMLTYGSRWFEKDWKINLSASARLAQQGFRDGTPYRGYSLLLSADKIIAGRHLINATGIVAYNNRGMASPMTEEVFKIKGNRYNAYWGEQEKRIRNSRLKRSFEPILQLNYSWQINAESQLNSHLTCQFGNSGRSRLDYGGSRFLSETGSIIGGGSNPDPTYYQKLPSYFLREQDNPDYSGAFLAGQRLVQDGQIDWIQLYRSNLNARKTGNSIYALYEDRMDDLMLAFQTDYYRRLSKAFELRSSLSARIVKSRRYALMLDLLGGSGYLDVDPFDQGVEESQSDLRNPNRIVLENEHFKYDYQIDSEDFGGFVRIDGRVKRHEYFVAGAFGIRQYRRIGLFENGSYPGDESLGSGPKLHFTTLSFKAGLTHKFNGRHLIQFFAAALQQPPAIKDSYSNIRENHDPVIGLEPKSSLASEVRYQLRLPKTHASVGGYFAQTKGDNRISFYYADGLTGLESYGTSAFVHEVMTGIAYVSSGVEISIEHSVTEEFKIKGVASVGSAQYFQNPLLYITSDELRKPVFYGASTIKGYHLPNGPQQAFSLGIEYSDPRYWWVGVTASWFDKSYIQVAPISRTKNFYTDPDGILQSSYDASIAKELLSQEKLPPFSLLNLVGGKSWKFKNMYLGFFASINNALNTLFRTGGFEQSRNANYRTLLEDRSREFPLFSPKYWYGSGTTFFASVYLRTH